MNNLKDLCCINGVYTIKENYTQEERKQGLSSNAVINFIRYRHKMLAFKEICINSQVYNKPLKNLLNFLLNTGVDITITVLGDTYKLHHTDNKRPCMWRFAYENCTDGWTELQDLEENENIQEFMLYSAIEFIKSQNLHPSLFRNGCFDEDLYNTIKTFVKTYANAYGLDLPKEQSSSTCNDYKPLKYLRGSTGNLSLADELNRKSTLKYYAKSRQAKEESPKEWVELARQIKAYLDYEIPFIDGFVKCKHCGKPINTWIVTDEQNEYNLKEVLFSRNINEFYNKCDFCNTLAKVDI